MPTILGLDHPIRQPEEHPDADAKGLYPGVTKEAPGFEQPGRLIERVPPEVRPRLAAALALPRRAAMGAVRALLNASLPAGDAKALIELAGRYLAARPIPGRLEKAATAPLYVGLPFRGRVAEIWPEPTGDVGKPHVTVFYALLLPDQIEAARDIIARELESYDTVPFVLGGLDYFRGGKDGDVAWVAVADVRGGIQALRERLRDALVRNDVAHVLTHGGDFKPHATLAYVDPGEEWRGHLPQGAGSFTVAEVAINKETPRRIRLGTKGAEMDPTVMQKADALLIKAREGLPDEVEIGAILGAALWTAQQGELAKGLSHKYIRKVPDGRGGWRYFYAVTGGKGLGHHEEFVEGAKFKLAHEGTGGHFEVMAREGSKVRIKHDETGHEEWVEAAALTAMLHNEHAKLLDAHRERTARGIAGAAKHGSEKQRQRLKEHAKRYAHTAHLADADAATGAAPKTVARHGRQVLAREEDGMPKTFANHAQAREAAKKVGGEVIFGGGRALLVAMPMPGLSAEEIEQRRAAAQASADKRRGTGEQANPTPSAADILDLSDADRAAAAAAARKRMADRVAAAGEPQRPAAVDPAFWDGMSRAERVVVADRLGPTADKMQPPPSRSDQIIAHHRRAEAAAAELEAMHAGPHGQHLDSSAGDLKHARELTDRQTYLDHGIVEAKNAADKVEEYRDYARSVVDDWANAPPASPRPPAGGKSYPPGPPAQVGRRVVFNGIGGDIRGEIEEVQPHFLKIAADDGTSVTLPRSFFQAEYSPNKSRGYPEDAHPQGAPSDIEIARLKRDAVRRREEDETAAATARAAKAAARAGWKEPKDRNETNVRLREVLGKIPALAGHKFSVRGSTGTGYGWIHIDGKTPEASEALRQWGREHGWTPSILSPDDRDKFLLFAETHAGTFVPGVGHKDGTAATKPPPAAGPRADYRPGEVVTLDGGAKRYVVVGHDNWGGGPRYHLAALSGSVRGSSADAIDPARLHPHADQQVTFEGAEAAKRRATALGRLRQNTKIDPSHIEAARRAIAEGGALAPLAEGEGQEREAAAQQAQQVAPKTAGMRPFTFDELRAEAAKATPAATPGQAPAATARPAGFEQPVAFTGELTEGTTARLGKPTWTAPTTGTVSAAQTAAMTEAAKAVKGWRSNGGWTFRSEADARAFMAQWGGHGGAPAPAPTPTAAKPSTTVAAPTTATPEALVRQAFDDVVSGRAQLPGRPATDAWEGAKGAGEDWRSKRAKAAAGVDIEKGADGTIKVTHRAADGKVTTTTHATPAEATKVYAGHRVQAQADERAPAMLAVAQEATKKLHGAVPPVPTTMPPARTEDRAAMEARHKGEIEALEAAGKRSWHDDHRAAVRRHMLEAFEAGHGPSESEISQKINVLTARKGGEHPQAWKAPAYREMQTRLRQHRQAAAARDASIAPATTRVRDLSQALYSSGAWRTEPPKAGELVADTRLMGSKNPLNSLEVEASHSLSARVGTPGARLLGSEASGDKREWRGLGMPFHEAMRATMASLNDDDLRHVARWNGNREYSPAAVDGEGVGRGFAVAEIERRRKAGTYAPPPELGERLGSGGRPIAGPVKPGDIARAPAGTTVAIGDAHYMRHHSGDWGRVNGPRGFGGADHIRSDDFEAQALAGGGTYSNHFGYAEAAPDSGSPTTEGLQAERAARRAALNATVAKATADRLAAADGRASQLRAMVDAPLPPRQTVTDFAGQAKALVEGGGLDRRIERQKGRVTVLRTEGRFGGPSWSVHEHHPDGKTSEFSHPHKRDAIQHAVDLEAAHAKMGPHPAEHLDLAHELDHLANMAGSRAEDGRSLWEDGRGGVPTGLSELADNMKATAKTLRGRINHGAADSRHVAGYGGGYAAYRAGDGKDGNDAPRPISAENLADSADRARHMIDRFRAMADGRGRYENNTHPRPDGIYNSEAEHAWDQGFTFGPGEWKAGDESVLPWRNRENAVAALKRAGMRPVPHGKFSVAPDRRNVAGAAQELKKSTRGRELVERAEALRARIGAA